MTPLTGLVLCGGASRRMGRDKALLPVDGRPLVMRVARRIEPACSPVLLSPGRPGRLGGLGYPEVADVVPGGGPLAGLVAGLVASPHRLIAAVAGDMPFASPEVLALLASVSEGFDVAVPVTESGREPLHAVYAREALPELRAALRQGRLALREAITGLRVRDVQRSEWVSADRSGRFALNLNRVEDLALL